MSAELKLALKATQAAWAVMARASAGPQRVTHKGAVDLVTEVDLACEEAVRAVLLAAMPDVPVLGEEGGGAAAAKTTWILDPVDGTTNFVHGFPWYATSLGLMVDGELRVGVVRHGVSGQAYYAERGGGAFCEGARLRVSATTELNQALVATGFPYDRRERAAFYLAEVRVMLERSQGVRRAGAASLDLAMVAAGKLDAYFEHPLQPWDVAAGTLLVREAGGLVTEHSGAEALPFPLAPLACGPKLHAEMVCALASAHEA